MLLTKKELEELTCYKRYSKQMGWLRNNGIRYLIGADGTPRVLKEHIEEIMGTANTIASKKKTVIDFDALKAYGKKYVSKEKTN